MTLARSPIHFEPCKYTFRMERSSAWILFLCLLLHGQTIFGSEAQDAKSIGTRVLELYKAGKYQEAVPLAKEIIAYDETVLGSVHPETAISVNLLALLYLSMRDYANAEPLYRRALEIREKALGPEHSATAESLFNLASLYHKMGNYAKAEPLYRRALNVREKVLGPEHSDTAMSLNNLAELYREIGDYTKAEPLYRRALAIDEKVLGSQHPETANTLQNLGLLSYQMGNYRTAESLYLRALRIDEEVLGPEHPHTAGTLSNLAFLYYQTGNYAKAEPLYRRALHIREKVLGPEDPETANTLDNVALLYCKIGDYAKAEALAERGLQINEKVLGPEHPSTAASLGNLAFLYYRIGNYAKAESLYRRALSIREKVFGPEHPDTAMTVTSLALLYEKAGDYASAEPLYQRALRIDEKLLGPEHPETAIALNNLALFYSTIGDYRKVEPLLQRALRIRTKVLGPEHPDTAVSLNNLAAFYKMMGNYANAESLLQRALAIKEKLLGADHRDLALGLNNLAGLYDTMGDYARAEPLYRRALQIHEKVLGPEHPDTLTNINNLGFLYYLMGNYAKAEPLFRRALRISERVLGPEHPDTASSVNNLAALELDIGNIAEARVLALRAQKNALKVLANVLSFGSEAQRLAYQDMIDPYTLFAATAGSDSELAVACLRNKGVVLDSIIEDRAIAEANSEKENRDLIERLSANRQRLGKLFLETPKRSADQMTKQIEELEKEIDQIEATFARNIAGLGRPRRALTITVEEVQSALPKDGALIEFVRYPHHLGRDKFEYRYAAIMLTTKEKPRWIPIGKADEIEKNVMRYRSGVADPDTADGTLEETLRGLYEEVWAPVERALPKQTRTVIISPDAQLNFVSFATLLTAKNHFLAEDRLVRYVSSGRDLLRETKLAPNSRLVAFANPDFSFNTLTARKEEAVKASQVALRGKARETLEELGLPPLPGTKAECAVLAERAKQWKWPPSQFLAADATEAELRKVRSPHVLHLATHGFVLDAQKEYYAGLPRRSPLEPTTAKTRYFENPMHQAGLVLAGAQTTLDAWRKGQTPPTENDGIVTAEEVGALKLEGTWLVTLSACNTGGGVAKAGEGVLGLRRGFIQAGAKNLLMTLWPIADETTVAFMTEFYDAAHKTGNAPRALAEVQRDWLVKLRKRDGLAKAVNLAGAFILSSQGKP